MTAPDIACNPTLIPKPRDAARGDRRPLPRPPVVPLSGIQSMNSSIWNCIPLYDPVLDPMTGRLRSGRPLSNWEYRMQPATILQTYLDEVGEAVMAERFADYAARVQLPLRIQTEAANLNVDTIEDLQDGFDDYTEMLRGYGVTDMVRSVKAAVFQGTNHVVGVYDTRLMAEAVQVLPTFHSKMWIGCYDGVWKAIKIHNTTKEARWPLLLTRLASDPWPIEET